MRDKQLKTTQDSPETEGLIDACFGVKLPLKCLDSLKASSDSLYLTESQISAVGGLEQN